MSVNVDTPTRNEHLGCPGWYIGVISGLLTSYSRYQAFVCKLAPIGVLIRKPNASRTLAKPKSNPKAKLAVLKLHHVPDAWVAVRHQCSSSFPCSSQDWQLFKLWKFGRQLNCHIKTIGLTFKVKATVRAIVETWKLTTSCVMLK